MRSWLLDGHVAHAGKNVEFKRAPNVVGVIICDFCLFDVKPSQSNLLKRLLKG
jgi:hypothetical protein